MEYSICTKAIEGHEILASNRAGVLGHLLLIYM